MFKAFEGFQIKGQVQTIAQTKRLMDAMQQKPDIPASKFKPLRGLSHGEVHEMLEALCSGSFSFKEMKDKAEKLKAVTVLKARFMGSSGCKTWNEANER